MKGVEREGERERNRGAGVWGDRTWDVSGQTEGTGSLAGVDERQGLGRLLGPDPTGGTGEVGGVGVGRALRRMHLTPSVQRD